MALNVRLSQLALPLWHSDVPKGSKPCGSQLCQYWYWNQGMEVTYYCVQGIRVQNKSLNTKCCVCGFILICSDTSFQTVTAAAASRRPHTLWMFQYSLVKGWRTFNLFFPWQRVSLKSISCQDTAERICLDCVSDVIGYNDNNLWYILK